MATHLAIDVLAEEGVLPKPFAQRFRALAGFRNLLVHGYLAVDVKRLHELLNERLDDFAEFAGHLRAFIEQDEPQT